MPDPSTSADPGLSMLDFPAMAQQLTAVFQSPEGKHCLASLGLDPTVLAELPTSATEDGPKYARAMMAILGILAIIAGSKAETRVRWMHFLRTFVFAAKESDSTMAGRAPEGLRVVISLPNRNDIARPRQIPTQRYRDGVRVFAEELKAMAESCTALPAVVEGQLATLAQWRKTVCCTRCRLPYVHRLTTNSSVCTSHVAIRPPIPPQSSNSLPYQSKHCDSCSTVSRSYLAKAIQNASRHSVTALGALALLETKSPKSVKKKHTTALVGLAQIGWRVYEAVLKDVDPFGFKAVALADAAEQAIHDDQQLDRQRMQIERNWGVASRAHRAAQPQPADHRSRIVEAQDETKRIARRMAANPPARAGAAATVSEIRVLPRAEFAQPGVINVFIAYDFEIRGGLANNIEALVRQAAIGLRDRLDRGRSGAQPKGRSGRTSSSRAFRDGDRLVAFVDLANANVAFEVGYALGHGKLVRWPVAGVSCPGGSVAHR